MIEEALKYLTSLGEQKGARFVPNSPNPEHIAILEKRDGTIDVVTALPEPRDHEAGNLTAIIQFASAMDVPAVWYSRKAVVCLCDDETRRDRVTLKLELSPQVKQLMAFESSPRQLKQAELVLLLRTTFGACLAPAGEILAAVRVLKFTSSGSGQSAINHGSVSVGKSLKQEMAGEKPLPETISLEVPIFSNASLPWTARVQVAIDVDAPTETFKLIPLPLEIERAIAFGERKIHEALDEKMKNVAIFYGAP